MPSVPAFVYAQLIRACFMSVHTACACVRVCSAIHSGALIWALQALAAHRDIKGASQDQRQPRSKAKA